MRKTLKVVAFGGGPADAFIKAAGITDSTQQTAIKTLVNDLNGYGLWTKMKAIYPMVGGNATAHSYNLKDTTKFQIAFSGGWTHASTGATPNGTNAFGDTKFGLNTLTQTNSHLSYYSRTLNDKAGYPTMIGSYGNAGYEQAGELYVRSVYPYAGGQLGSYNTSIASYSESSAQRHVLLSRTSSTSLKYYSNGTLRVTNSTTDTTGFGSYNIYLGAGNYLGTGASYSQAQCAFATIGEGLSDTEAANLYTSIQKFQTTLGRYVGTPIVSDSDAQTFLNTASITDLTQANAVNTLVTDLKGANLWTKMKALYPMVGGTASSHSYNLKNPTQFQITWNGGITHSSTGALPNGTNGYGDTNLNALSNLTYNSTHLAYYSRTANGTGSGKTELGTQNGASSIINLGVYTYSAQVHACAYNNSSSALLVNNSTNNSSGFYVANRASSTSLKSYRNAVSFGTNSNTSAGTIPNNNIYLAANGNTSSKYEYSDRECAFASIGDGLTDTDASNLYNIIQNYQISLGRSVGPQTVSDTDAQLFINTANIQDQIQATAVNTLVTDLKSNNLWTKMKAVYPMVGGTASTHKFNLKDPRDLDAAYRLVFNGGWTHSSTGALPNGSNGYANTFLTPSVHSSQNSSHLSFYSRTNLLGSGMDIGQIQTIPDLRGFHMGISYSGSSNQMRTRLNSANASTSYTPTDTRGLFSISRINSSEFKGYRNSSNVFTFTESSNTPGNVSMTIGCINTTSGQSDYASHECAFATIGDGLTDAESSTLYTIIQNYQTILSRNI